MNCQNYKKLLFDYIEGWLDDKQNKDIELHIASCPECKNELEQVKALQSRLIADGNLNRESTVENDVMNKIIREQALRLRKNESKIHFNFWRLIMKNSIIKFAAAALILIAAGFAIYFFIGEGTRTCCAWTKIADKIRQIRTCVYKMHMEQKSYLGIQVTDSNVYVSSEYGIRADSYSNDVLGSQIFAFPSQKLMINVAPTIKKYMKTPITEDTVHGAKQVGQDPRDIIAGFMTSSKLTELGEQTLNGIKVKGVQVVDPLQMKGYCDSYIGKLWVDVATELPVKLEIEMIMPIGEQKMHMSVVAEDFQWEIPLAPDLFKPDIPADYTMMGEMIMPAQDETDAIEGFKFFSKVTKGKYPSSLNDMTTTQETQQSLMAEMNLAPGTQPDDAMQQELVNKAIKLHGPFIFYNKLNQQGKAPVYHGDKVTAEFGEAVLMRWKVSDKEYRVILGDLTVKTVSADELAALEAIPLNRTPKAIKPKPADKSVYGQIKDLELSWMPGLYAAKQKIYMGTAPDKLDLLADATDDSNLIVAELKRDTTYYWRVDAIDANNKITTGDVWSFYTGKLVGWWKFDETTGTIASDSSGNGNNGVLKGNPVWKPQGGKTGGAIELGGKDDYVEIGNESAFDINDKITISAWVNITDVPQEWTAIITKGDSAWRMSTSYAKNAFHFGVAGSDYLNGQITVDSGQWHNVACVYDGQQMRIYVDGKLDVTATQTGPIATNNFPVCIGENLEVKGRCFHGLIDDVRIYNYALTEDEAADLFNCSH